MSSRSTQTSLDRFGRIVLPIEIRHRFHLAAGSELQIEEAGDAIILKPLIPQAQITEKDGWHIVKSSQALSPEAIIETIQKVRGERVKG